MLKPINDITKRVADGRRFASRSIVITSLTAISCYVFRRHTIPAKEGESRAETVWQGGIVLSEHEEHATEYKEQGYAMLQFDRFSAGSLHTNGDNDINIGESVLNAQIEPFFIENYNSKADMLRNVPEWRPEKGDIFALVVEGDLIKWVECIGVSGQTLHAHHGETYALTFRDSLMHLDPFRVHEDLLKPASNPFPMLLSDLMYSDAPIFNVVENDPTNLADDEVSVKVFKLVNLNDSALKNYPAVLAVNNIIKATQSPYIFTAEDQAKITVNVGLGEHYILTTSEPVKAIEASGQFISYMLMMFDHVSVVQKITKDLADNKPVKVTSDGRDIFEFLPLHYDEMRKTYHFIFTLALGQSTEFTLQFTDGAAYTCTVDATGMEAA